MENLKILNTREKKKFLDMIKRQWGVDFSKASKDIAFLLSRKNDLYLINMDFREIDEKKLHIERVGLYFGEVLGDELRLSIEGSQLIGPLAKKNVLEIDENSAKEWIKGKDIEIENVAGESGKKEKLSGFLIIKKGEDFMGCGKLKNGKVLNYIPKARRILVD